ncbi:nuclear transport factor 2 family protein [Streptomyces sp. NPDC091377]|uniref:nuclear transport factor 2 family protein n=1 Tax=Streptomyces sp. NPDC091377 TaxID=3365995 RepID=UPI00380183CD
MTDGTLELFAHYHAAWEVRDPDRVAALHTEDSLFHLHLAQPPARGRTEIRAAVADTFALVPDLAFTLVSLRAGDDFWVTRFRLTGTAAATGAAIDVDLADFVLVQDAAVKEKHSYVDGIAMRAAMPVAATQGDGRTS